MRTTILAALTASALLATPALAAPNRYDNGPRAGAQGAEVAVGAATGTAVGVGLANGWWGASPAIAGTALPTTAAGAAAVGGVAGIGTIAAIDSVIQPCRGFQALFGLNHGACDNGEYVGYAPQPVYRR